MAPRPHALAGIGLMLLGIFLFAANDALGKWLVTTYTVGQLLLIRSLAALLVLLPFLWRQGLAPLRSAPQPGLQLLRVCFSTLEVACFYWAVASLPLVDVMTFYLAGPIYVAALAAGLLGERIDRPRAMAILAGFAGVLITLRPSAALLTWPALVALAGSLSFALLMIATRQLRGTTDATLVLGQTLGALGLGLVLAPAAWVSPGPLDLALLSFLGVTAMVAHLCVNRSLKLAPASVVVPYQYTTIVWAALLGYLVFGDAVQPWTAAGAAVIVTSGLVLWRLEQRAAYRDPGPTATPPRSAQPT